MPVVDHCSCGSLGSSVRIFQMHQEGIAFELSVFHRHGHRGPRMRNRVGDCMPLVEVKIPPQQTMISECGAFSYYQDGVKMENFFNDGQPAAA